MPGMMDTVLNLGLTDASVEQLAAAHSRHMALDCHRRFLQMYGEVVLGVPHRLFEAAIAELRERRGVQTDSQLSEEDLSSLVAKFKEIIDVNAGPVPEDPRMQLKAAIEAVFASWGNERAEEYRRVQGLSGLLGTAVNVQMMVYGNTSENSATGVCFSRDPGTGAPGLYGEFLVNAQGEDVVAGVRTPKAISALAQAFPECFEELGRAAATLEKNFKDMQDMEFTIEEGKLWMLQTRRGKRTGRAAVRVALDLVQEGLVDKGASLDMVTPKDLAQLLLPQFSGADERAYREEGRVLGTGLAASPGAAVGQIVFSAPAAAAWSQQDKQVILVRHETSADDVGGMHASEGILTACGGMTSHAAVVARGWGKPCVCGLAEMAVSEGAGEVALAGRTLKEGDWISINGTTGEVVLGRVPRQAAAVDRAFEGFLELLQDFKGLGVKANADTPQDAAAARKFGASGVGLCRTEHMFFSAPARVLAVRRAILAQGPAQQEALDELERYQEEDFRGILREMAGLPVIVRLLDPPLHEFLPRPGGDDARELAAALGADEGALARRIRALGEKNPMLGLRGCRLLITRPALLKMQVRALVNAALRLREELREAGEELGPVGVMVPLVVCGEEMRVCKALVDEAAEEAFARKGLAYPGPELPFSVGCMVETPRACLAAKELVEAGARFFSFGTNDLTQMTMGISRDDGGAFLPAYREEGILPQDPFKALDGAVLGLMETAALGGRAAAAGLEVGVCGEQGGDPGSIRRLHEAGAFNYVSVSPFRVPGALLASAQAKRRGAQAGAPAQGGE